jgi:hypothetical protein
VCLTCILQGTSLRCLVPHFIADACPQLTSLKIIQPNIGAPWSQKAFVDTAAACLPLKACSSLKQLELEIDDKSMLPPAYHQIADLQRHLPNIDTLIFVGRSPCVTLIQAFATQLTRCTAHVEYRLPEEYEIQAIRSCSKLQHLRTSANLLPDIASNLKVLEVLNLPCLDADYKKLLQLPSVSVVRIWGFHNLKHDYSQHACSWQKLHVEYLTEFSILAQLCLSSVTTLTTGPKAVSMTTTTAQWMQQ